MCTEVGAVYAIVRDEFVQLFAKPNFVRTGYISGVGESIYHLLTYLEHGFNLWEQDGGLLAINDFDFLHGLFDKIYSGAEIPAIAELGLIPLLDKFLPVLPALDILAYFIDIEQGKYNSIQRNLFASRIAFLFR